MSPNPTPSDLAALRAVPACERHNHGPHSWAFLSAAAWGCDDCLRLLIAAIAAQVEPKCSDCGGTATCLGCYEGHLDPSYSCDRCCGHGSEDGYCLLLPSRYGTEA